MVYFCSTLLCLWTETAEFCHDWVKHVGLYMLNRKKQLKSCHTKADQKSIYFSMLSLTLAEANAKVKIHKASICYDFWKALQSQTKCKCCNGNGNLSRKLPSIVIYKYKFGAIYLDDFVKSVEERPKSVPFFSVKCGGGMSVLFVCKLINGVWSVINNTDKMILRHPEI